MEPIICSLCGGEIPVGHPVATYQVGDTFVIVHRFSTMCDEKIKPQIEMLERWHDLPDDRDDIPSGGHAGTETT